MATKFEKVLDTVHAAATALAQVTSPKKKKLDRDTLIKIFNVTTTILGAVALLIPQVKAVAIAANVLAALNQTASTFLPNDSITTDENVGSVAALVPTEK